MARLEATAPVGRRPSVWAPEWRALTVGLIVTVTLVASEALAVATVLPLVAHDLHGLALYGWVMSAFFLGTLVGLVVGAEEIDRRGPAMPFAAALAIFAAGLLVAGLAPAMWVVVVGRALQGLGAGAIPAVAYASIGRAIPDALRPRVFALLSTAWVLPGLAGPAVAAAVAAAAGWRVVFVGLVPLVAVAAVPPYRALRRLGPPAEPPLAERSLLALPMIVAAAALGARPLRALLPSGTLTARAGLPATILTRGLLTFGFFGADTFVPLAIVSVRHQPTAVGGIALTAATLSWSAASWVQERLVLRWSPRRLVGVGLAIVAAGTAGVATALLSSVPIAVAPVAWGIAGFGIGLAYSTLSLSVLAEAPPGQEGRVSAALQLCDNLGIAFGAGLGGAAVAVAAAHGREAIGVGAAYALAAAMALLGVAVTRRLPAHVLHP